MKLNRKLMFYIVLPAIVILVASVMYANLGQKSANAAGCGMSGMNSDMSNCPMMGGAASSGNDNHHNEASVAPAVQPGTTVNGTIIAVNKAQRTVSLRLDLPVTGDAAKAVSKVRTGDTVTATIVLDKSGSSVATGITRIKGTTVTLSIIGIQCQACADRLQSSLKSVPGINGVKVTANPAQAVITYDQSNISVDEIKDTVRNTKPIHEDTPFNVKD